MSLFGQASGNTLRGRINRLTELRGYSAYEVAVINGYDGTEEEWLESIYGLSESWAVGGTGLREGEDIDNAKYWAEQAHSAAGGGVVTFNGRDGSVVPQSGDYTAAMVGAIPASEKGAPNGVAELDATGKVPTAQLPDTMTPAAHASQHASGGSDPIAPDLIGALPVLTGAGFHNAIYRGKYLGASVTAEQYAAIAAGTFDGLYIGDYWTIGGVNWRIAAFDYYYSTGDLRCRTHHVTVVPDTILYSNPMNDTAIVTGAYVGSKLYNTGLDQAKAIINDTFGADHILRHRVILQNAVADGFESGGSWYDSTVEIMSERNVYGATVFANCMNGVVVPYAYTVDKSQYPLFAFCPDIISSNGDYWLRDVANNSEFSRVAENGSARCGTATGDYGVRPAFSIVG